MLCDEILLLNDFNFYLNASFLGEFDSIRQQTEQHLHHTLLICVNHWAHAIFLVIFFLQVLHDNRYGNPGVICLFLHNGNNFVHGLYNIE